MAGPYHHPAGNTVEQGAGFVWFRHFSDFELAMNPALMTQADFASHRGVVKSAVSNWKKDGLLVMAEGPRGKLLVDVKRTEAKLNGAIDPTRGRPLKTMMEGESPRPSGQGELGEVRTELLREQRLGQRFKNAQSARELVPLAEYENRIAELGRLTRERMHSMVRSAAERLAAEHDPRVITSLLAAEIDRSFAELADQAEGGAFAAIEDDLPDEPDAAGE
jgi:phage terminase Nu1 subunit (DNA packaging protein)